MEIREIFRVVAKWSDNNGCKISGQSLKNWLTGYQKASFHFGPSSTVGQTVELDYSMLNQWMSDYTNVNLESSIIRQ